MAYPYPILFKIGPFRVFTFGLFMFISFLISLFIALKRRGNIDEEHIYNIAIISLITGIIGARISFFVLAPQYLTSFFDFIAIWQGGMGFLGGFILALISSFLYIRWKKLDFWKLADIFAPPLALGIAITRIGGFIAGVNPGLPTQMPWGVMYNGILTHPAAIYHALANFVIFFFLLSFEKKIKEKFYTGSIFMSFLLLYSTERFFLDFFRAYDSFVTILAARIVWPAMMIASALILLNSFRSSTRGNKKVWRGKT